MRWDPATRQALTAATRIAAAAPLKQGTYVHEVRVPWAAVHDLRVALDAMSIDWRGAKEAGERP